MRTDSPGRVARVVVTLVILFVLALQAQAVFPLRRIWPFLDYPMYRTAHHAGEAVHRFHVVGVLADGTEVDVGPDALGISFFQHLYGPVGALQRGDREELAVFTEIYRERHGEEIVGARLEDHPVFVTEEGLREGDIDVVTRMSLGEETR